MKITRFEDLDVWQRARELTKLVYKITKFDTFNQDQRLRNQIRDSCVSIMANIAEGFSRNSDKEFRQFLFVAKGSAAEVHSYVSLDQHYVAETDFRNLYEETDHVSRMLSNLIQYLARPSR